jgi:DinB superfamily
VDQAQGMTRPGPDEAAPYYSKYIDRVPGDDVLGVLARQSSETLALLRGISEERSRHRYAPGKWSIRELLSHLTDTERVFAYRALWFARGFTNELPSFDQDVAAAGAKAEGVAWAAHVDEFASVRQATVALFRNLPAEAWSRGGVASGNRVTVRALAYIIAGHEAHHVGVLKERYSS